MTNEQLAVLLKGWYHSLIGALNDLNDELPDSLESYRPFGQIGNARCKVLDPLYELLSDVYLSTEWLLKNEGENDK
jgi:hypothetical protein